MSAHRVTIVSSIFGAQRFSIELPCTTITVQMKPRSAGPGEALFAFKIDNNYLVGSTVAAIGMMQRNGIVIATIAPAGIPTRKRLAFRASPVIVGHLNYAKQQFPLSCTLWLGLIGTGFTLRDTNGRHLAYWKRWNTRTKLVISAKASDELFHAILGLVIYTEVEKGNAC